MPTAIVVDVLTDTSGNVSVVSSAAGSTITLGVVSYTDNRGTDGAP